MESPEELPSAAGDIARTHPAIWKAYSALGKASAEAGPVEGATLRLVKLALERIRLNPDRSLRQ
jgi:hypothetical protein